MKRLFIVGLIAASWALVIGIAMCAQLALAQSPVPPEVTNEALTGWRAGGFQAVAVVLAAGLVASWVASWRMLAAKDVIIASERSANRELVTSMKNDSIGSTQTYGKIETTLALTNQAMLAMADAQKGTASEVRILGDKLRDRGAA